MRELKFRVWDEITKSYFIESHKVQMRVYSTKNVSISHLGLVPLLEQVIEQFTGLVDKNGKEIYENDLIKAVGKNVVDDTLSVVFKNGAFCLKLGQESQPFFNDDYDIDFTLSHIEVIGNIHENGDLLKGEL